MQTCWPWWYFPKKEENNTVVQCQRVKARGLDVYKFEQDGPQSFYRIMAHYAEWLDHIPLEQRQDTEN